MNIDNDAIIDQLLCALSNTNEDCMDALQFTDDFRYPLDWTARCIAKTIRDMHEYFSDSTVNDLLSRLDDMTCYAPGCRNEATLVRYIGNAPDLENGPSPNDFTEIRACSDDHMNIAILAWTNPEEN